MNSLFPQNLVESLGWTLVHFLWQGVAIAALLAAALWLLRRAKPNHRYLAGCAALLLLAAMPVLTFNHLIRQQQTPPVLKEILLPQAPAQPAAPLATVRP